MDTVTSPATSPATRRKVHARIPRPRGSRRDGTAARRPTDTRGPALRRFAASITAATVVGHAILGFEQAYVTPIAAVIAALLTELVLETLEAWACQRQPRYQGSLNQAVTFFLPAYITGMACAMLLYGNQHVMPYVLAAVIGVASKYVLKVTVDGRGRHFLNPSNFGIVAVLLLFPWVGIAPPYQFTEWVDGWLDALVPAAVLVLGTMLNARLTGKMPLILGWVGGFIAQALFRGTVTDISLISALLPITGTAFVLYTNYMITDPGTTPAKPRNQVIFGAATAVVYGLLVHLHIVFGLFFALAIVCTGRGLALAILSWSQGFATSPRPAAPQPVLGAGETAAPAQVARGLAIGRE